MARTDPYLEPPIKLTQNPFTDESPAWSPDGRRIAFVSWRDGAGRQVASGVYVYRLLARPLGGGPPQTQTRRMVLLR